MSRTILGEASDKFLQAKGEPALSVPPFKRGDEGKSRPLTWLWKDRVSFGTITLLVGNPGLGKGTITCDMAARVTTGRVWPGGAPAFGPRNAVILSAEDPSEEIVLPRLKVAGADMTRTHYLPMDSTFLMDDAKHMAILRKLVWKFDPALIVLDPLDDFISKWTDSAQSQSVRLGLKALKQLAYRHHIAIVCILHLNKKEDLPALQRILGSVAFGAISRSALVVAPDAEGRTFFGPMKGNYSKKGTPALLYTLVEGQHPDVLNDPEETISHVEWGGEYEVDMAALLEKRAVEAKPLSKLEGAKAFLARELGDGQPHPSTPLKAKAAAERISAETLRNAREALKVEAPYVQGLGWCWRLPAPDPDNQ